MGLDLILYLYELATAKLVEATKENATRDFVAFARQLLRDNPPTEVMYTDNGIALRLADNTVVNVAPASASAPAASDPATAPAPAPATVQPTPSAPGIFAVTQQRGPTGDMQDDAGVIAVTTGQRNQPERERF